MLIRWQKCRMIYYAVLAIMSEISLGNSLTPFLRGKRRKLTSVTNIMIYVILYYILILQTVGNP